MISLQNNTIQAPGFFDFSQDQWQETAQKISLIAIHLVAAAAFGVGVFFLSSGMLPVGFITLISSCALALINQTLIAPTGRAGEGINPAHFDNYLQIVNIIPRQPRNYWTQITQLRDIAQNINFDRPDAPCYVFAPDKGQGNYQKYQNDRERFNRNIEELINKFTLMTNHSDEFYHDGDEVGVKNLKLLIEKYQGIEDDLINPTSNQFIRESDLNGLDPAIRKMRDQQIQQVTDRNRAIMQLIETNNLCNTARKNAVLEALREAYGVSQGVLEQDVKKVLELYRYEIFRSMARDITEKGGQMMDEEHLLNLVYYVGPLRGYVGDGTSYPALDTAREIEAHFHTDWITQFDRMYTRNNIIDRIQEGMNGVELEGKLIRQFPFASIRDWFIRNLRLDYPNVSDEQIDEAVFEDPDNYNYNIKREAVEYFLNKIRVIY